MNILFVFSLDQIYSFERPLSSQEQMQFGISYISSHLKQKKHKTSLTVLTKLYREKSKRRIDEEIKRFKPKLVCFTSVATEYDFINEIAGYIRQKYPSLYLIVGGPHPSINPHILESSNFDALCIGEGEDPTLEVVKKLHKKKIPIYIKNLWIKNSKDGSIIKNSVRPFEHNIDHYAFPDRAMWQRWVADNPGSKTSVLLGRGCPFSCTYCCNHALRKITSGQYVRVRSILNIIDELVYLKKKKLIHKFVHLEIETIGVNREWTIKLAQGIETFNKKYGVDYVYSVNLRIVPGYTYHDIFEAFKRANILILHIGLESGSEKIRKLVLRRIYSNEQLIEVTKLAKTYGIEFNFFNLVGIPHETKEDFDETINMNRICEPKIAMTSIFFPYPGTDLYNLCIKEGLIKSHLDSKMERSRAVLDLPGFSKKQIQDSYDWFDYSIYKGKMSSGRLIARVLRRKMSSSPTFSILMRKIDATLWQFKVYEYIKDRLLSHI